jgi:hypothetical protein
MNVHLLFRYIHYLESVRVAEDDSGNEDFVELVDLATEAETEQEDNNGVAEKVEKAKETEVPVTKIKVSTLLGNGYLLSLLRKSLAFALVNFS